jgi:hypothetical protein
MVITRRSIVGHRNGTSRPSLDATRLSRAHWAILTYCQSITTGEKRIFVMAITSAGNSEAALVESGYSLPRPLPRCRHKRAHRRPGSGLSAAAATSPTCRVSGVGRRRGQGRRHEAERRVLARAGLCLAGEAEYIHVLMVLLSSVWNNMRSMITGWYVIKSESHSPWASGLTGGGHIPRPLLPMT